MRAHLEGFRKAFRAVRPNFRTNAFLCIPRVGMEKWSWFPERPRTLNFCFQGLILSIQQSRRRLFCTPAGLPLPNMFRNPDTSR